jgi:hypothetical protein
MPELIVAYCFHDLGPAEHRKVTDHLRTCGRCHEKLLGLQIALDIDC